MLPGGKSCATKGGTGQPTEIRGTKSGQPDDSITRGLPLCLNRSQGT